jgi:hypothetical protein
MGKIYCISGLGVDFRLFRNISIKCHTLVYLPWVPCDSKDGLPSYAMKMMQQVKEKNPVILGYSLGGMMAIEIGKLVPTSNIFLVSSAKTRTELGYRNELLKWVAGTKIVPTYMRYAPDFMLLYLLGARTEDEKKLIREVVRDSDPSFVRSCINMLLTWENESYPANITHIHGTDDKVIRSANVHPDHWIKGGTHIMIYNRADEINKIISARLSE